MSAWNPGDKAAGITLSNTNHTATGSGGNNSVRGATSHNTGQWYFELTGITFVGSARLGVADSTQGLSTTTLGNSAGSTNDVATFADGFNGTSVALGTTTGHTVSVAVDLSANKMWMRIDGGSWVGDGVAAGDPVAGTHGAVISARAGALFPFAFLQNGGTVTYNGGDSSFLQSLPTGYAGWENVAAKPVLRRPVVIF